MKNISILIFLFSVSILAEDNPYKSISARNAFDLTSKPALPDFVLPPIDDITAPTVFLTGITRLNGVKKVHLILRKAGEPDKFVSLKANEKLYNLELKKVLSSSAIISSYGKEQVISFEKNGLPTIVTKAPLKAAPKKGSSVKKEQKKIPIDFNKAQIIKVPSRRPQVDPRIIEKGLEYLGRMEEGEKRDYLLKRMEALQSGQRQIKSNIDQNERRRQYDEWKKNR